MDIDFIKKVLYLPSGRIFLAELDGYTIEFTEMRDVSIDGKLHAEVRESQDPRIIWKHLVDYEDKWLLTVSTQKGCAHSCQFCDVAKLPFRGNLEVSEIYRQIRCIIDCTPYVRKSKKVKIGFARMGEPAWNLKHVLSAIKYLPELSADMGKDFNWLPCFNTILPEQIPDAIEEVAEVKESVYDGFLHLQISCNSTDEWQREKLFGGAKVIMLDRIIDIVNKLKITNRTVTLNFIVMEGIEVSVDRLRKMGLNKDKFTVKLIPLNKTYNAESNGLETYANYSNYDKLLELKKEFEQNSIPVVVDAIARCEEAGLCCGQLAQIYR